MNEFFDDIDLYTGATAKIYDSSKNVVTNGSTVLDSSMKLVITAANSVGITVYDLDVADPLAPVFYKDTVAIENIVTEMNHLQTGDTVIAETTLEDADGTLLLALYENGRLVEISKAGGAPAQTLSTSLVIPEDAVIENCSIKAFLWNDMIGLLPLVRAGEL